MVGRVQHNPMDGLGPTDNRQPASYQNVSRFPAIQLLNFQTFRDIVTQFDTLEPGLEAVSSRFPEYLKFHTLMYDSQSIQGSTFTAPRVLVFGPTGAFVFTFNEKPELQGSKSFETMEYSFDQHRFLFREIFFKGYGFDRDELFLDSNEIESETDKYVVSKPNPSKCQNCHGQVSRPIWASYFLWPGAYGSDDDTLRKQVDAKLRDQSERGQLDGLHSLGRGLTLKPGIIDRELEGIIQYLRIKPSHRRYRCVPSDLSDAVLLQYGRSHSALDLDLTSTYASEQTRLGLSGSNWPGRPNLFFLFQLQALNQNRLLFELQQAGVPKNLLTDILPAHLTIQTPIEALPSQQLDAMATKIESVLTGIAFRGIRPSFKAIKKRLVKNLREEMEMEIEKVKQIDKDFGTGAVVGQAITSYQKDGRHGVYNHGLPIPDLDGIPFYSFIMNRPQPSDIEKAAYRIGSDDVVFNTIVEVVFDDYGVNLHDYVMNHLQKGLSFNDGGLNEVLHYMGVQ